MDGLGVVKRYGRGCVVEECGEGVLDTPWNQKQTPSPEPDHNQTLMAHSHYTAPAQGKLIGK